MAIGSGFLNPGAVAVDSGGNVFVADTSHSAVKEIVAVNGVVNSRSVVKTIGSGFAYPYGVAVDSNGNVFVGDYGNNAVKEIVAVNGVVSSDSTVNTIGSGFSSPIGIAVDGSGNVFVADYSHGAVKEIVAVNGAVSSSSIVISVGSGFSGPYGVTVDGSGNVFVADWGSSLVKEIVAVNGVVGPSSTVNTIGSGFISPDGVAVDGSGNVFVADSSSVKEIVAVNGVVSSSSTVKTVSSRFSSAYAVAVDGNDNIFVADYSGNAVKEILSGAARFSGTTDVGSTSSNLPVAFTFDAGGTLASTPYVVLTQGKANADFQAAPQQDSNACVGGQTYSAGDSCSVMVAFTPTLPFQRKGAVQLMGASGTPIATSLVYGTGSGPMVTFPSNSTISAVGSGFNQPHGAAVDRNGNVFVADAYNNAVKEIVAVNGVVSSGSTVNTISTQFSYPYGIAVDSSGNVFVADSGNDAVKEIVAVNGAVSATSTVITVGNGFNGPAGVAVDERGNVFVADFLGHAVKEIVAVNGVVNSSSTVKTVGHGISFPYGIAVDSSGNVFVADSGNNAVKEIVAVNGEVSATSTVIAVGSGFAAAAGVAVDGSGNVFVADTTYNAVKEIVAVNGVVSSNSTVNTISTQFSYPYGVAVDSSGNVFVADSGNNAVKELNFADAPSLSFASTIVGSASSDSPQTVTLLNIGNKEMSIPIPLTGSNPSISTGFTWNSTASPACPQITSTSSSQGVLPAGSSCTLSISFTPMAAGTISGSLTLTDNALNASYATQVISLNGTAISSLTATQSIASLMLTQNGVASTFIPVTGSGGTGALTYSIIPALPAGLSFSTSTGAISGTPTTTLSATTFTVTIADESNAAASNSFTLTVNEAVTATRSIASKVLTQNYAGSSFTPVTGSGGTGTRTYSVNPALPAGLTLNTSTGAISGAPTATLTATTFTVTVTDANSATASNTFVLTVNSAVTATQSIASKALTQSYSGASFTPVTGNGGTGTLTYSISPSLPNGLMLSSSTGAISGAPTATLTATTFTVTVTDANNATASNTFVLTVNSAVTATQSIASKALTQNDAASFTPVTGSGGTGTLTYTVSTTLPTGLSFSTSTGAISGTPSATLSATTFIVTVTDINGATASSTFSLAVNSAVTATRAITSSVLTQNHATSFTPVTGGGGTGTLTYSISPSLPSGLTLSSSTGVISGTPTATLSVTTFTVTVTDTNGATASNMFALTVNAAVTATQTVPSTTLTYSVSITSFIPVTGSGGTGTLSYHVSPTLPAGLSYSGTTGMVSGTPTATQVATSYTVTVTDANGATVSNTFALAVSKATATITTLPVATAITYGQTLANSTLSGGVAMFNGNTVAGSFAWTNPTTVPAVGAPNESVTFTPIDTGNYSVVTGTVTLNVGTPGYVINVSNDDAGTASNCTTQSSTTSNTTDSACSLRDALLAAANAGAANIYFDTTVFANPTTITLSHGTLPVSTKTIINGATSGSGLTQENLITVNGGGPASNFSIFTVGSGVVDSAIHNLTMANGYVTSQGGAINNSGTLAVTNCTFANNYAGGYTTGMGNGGGAIYNASGTLMISNSTFSGNTSSPGGAISLNSGSVAITNSTFSSNAAQSTYAGGAIFINTSATLTVLNSTFSANTAAGGGAIMNYGTLAITNSIIANNGAGGLANSGTMTLSNSLIGANSGGDCTGTCPANGTNGNIIGVSSADLSPLGNYGGATQTLIPLPNNPAVCAGSASIAASGSLTSDQRGLVMGLTTSNASSYTGVGGYCPAGSIDMGAVQSNYGLSFSTQPSDVVQNTAMSPAPAVILQENGAAFTAASVTIPLTLTSNPSGATLSGGSAATNAAVATYSSLKVDTVGMGDMLTASLAPLSVSATSNSFAVTSSLTVVQAIASKALTQNVATSPFTPVIGSGGTGTLTYSISPALPMGLSLNPSTGAISGTPIATSMVTTYIVTVTDASNTTASNSFSLTVNGALTATQAVASKALTQNHATTALIPVTGGGGTGALTFRISPSLPSGLSFSSSTGAITGTATVTLSATTFTVTVADTNGATASNTFSLTVNAAVTATQAVPSTSLTEGHAATLFTPVTGSNGTGPLTYSVSPTMPNGLSLSSSTGAITGTTTVTLSATTFTVTVTDTNGATASSTFSLTVNAAVTAMQVIASKVLTQNQAVTPFTPVTSSGGTGTLTYSISPALPAGLSFSSSTGLVTGTPSVTSTATIYTVTGTDLNGATATADFSLTVNTAVTATQAIPTTALTYGTTANFTPVVGSGGTGTLTYSISPSLPSALSMNSSTGIVSGIPIATQAVTSYTVTVTDANGATASNTFALTVNKATPTITTEPTASTIVFGQTLASSTLSGGEATFNGNAIAGSFAWTTPTTAPGAGVPSESVTFTPNDTANYQSVTGTVMVTVNKAPVTITWSTPSSIVYGTALGMAQLNATASVAGSFTYTPTLGTVLAVGRHTLSVSFTPKDTSNYTAPAASTVDLTVTAAPLTVIVDSANRPYGSANPILTGIPSGLVNGDTATAIGLTYSTTATQSSAVGVYPITASITSTNYTLSVTQGMLTVTGATLTVTANNATKVYGTVNPTFSGSVTGQQNGDAFTANYTTTATTSSPVGSYAIVPIVTGTNLADYTVNKTNGTLTVTQAATSLALAADAKSIVPGQNLTLTATVADATSGSTGTPTGTITFFNGKTTLGTSTLTNGVASFTTNALTPGTTYALSASYGGDINFTASVAATSISVTVAPLDFTLTPPTNTNLTGIPSGTVQSSFSVTPMYGALAGPMNFTVTGLPTGATISFSPLSLDASTSSAQTITMTIKLPAATAQNQQPHRPGRPFPPIALGLLLLPFATLRRVRRSALVRMTLLFLSVAGIGTMTGCGSGNGFNVTASQNYTVTVTATAGSLTHTFQINLNVQ